MRVAITAALLGGMYASFPACAADNELAGTYKLVISLGRFFTGTISPVSTIVRCSITE